MKKFLAEYSRTILIIIVIIILILMLTPFGAKIIGVSLINLDSLNTKTTNMVKNVGNTKLKEGEFYFYVEGEQYIGREGWSWRQWVLSDYNKDKKGNYIFSIYYNPCTGKYRIGFSNKTSASEELEYTDSFN